MSLLRQRCPYCGRYVWATRTGKELTWTCWHCHQTFEVMQYVGGEAA